MLPLGALKIVCTNKLIFPPRIFILVILQSLSDEADLERGRRVHHQLRGLAPQHQARLPQSILNGERGGVDSTKSIDYKVRGRP